MFRACLRRAGKPDKLLALTRIAPGLTADASFAPRFDALMSEVANIVHPALCAIEDVGDYDGAHVVAAELVSGRDLAQVHAALAQRGQSLPSTLVAYIANQVADGLAAAHRATRGGQPSPLCHGELALSEILIGYDGNVRLTGLGSHALRGFVRGLGRRGYRAPELERDGVCDPRSDVFSLGACMYELLTGAPATRNDGHSESAPLPRPQSHITRVVPRSLEPIVSRALADDPAARFQSATELGRALRRWSLAQTSPGDARALSAFLLTHFDAERDADERGLREALARIPDDATATSLIAPRARTETPVAPGTATPARAGAASAPSASRAGAYSYVRSVAPPKAAPTVPQMPAARAALPAARAGQQRFDDLAEHTPPRGQLMNELAATMTGVDSPVAARASGDAAGSGEPRAWDDETPAHAWISVSEEQVTYSSRRTPSQPIAVASTAASGSTPSAASTPAPAARSQAANVAPRSIPAPRARTSSHAPAASATQPAPLELPRAPSAQARPAAARKRSSALPAIALAAIGVIATVVALVALLAPHENAAPRATLRIQTHPAGAEVFVQGKRLGTSPLRRDDMTPGAITLELRKDGFEPITRRIELTPAQVFQLDVDLSSRRVEVHQEAVAAAQTPEPEDSVATERPQEHGSAPHSERSASEARRRRSDARGSSEREASAEPAEHETAQAPEPASAPTAQTPATAVPAGDALAGIDDEASASAGSASTQTPSASTSAPSTGSARTSSASKPEAPAPAATSKTVSRAATPIAQETPRFPARARRAGISEGSVTLEYTVDRGGAVKQARVVQADPPGVFDDAALRAIEKWRYQPKLDGGKPVDSRLRFTFKFRE